MARFRKLGAFIALIALASGLSTALARAQTEADTFRGRTITLYVASGAGGGYGLNALLIAAHLGHFLPGNPTVIPSYMPGSGGIKAANYLYNAAPKDGTALGVLVSTVQVEQLVRTEATMYDVRNFQWIGVVAPIRPVLWVSKKAPASTLDELRRTQITAGASGKGSPTYVVPTLAVHALGLKIKVITGYKGTADTQKAMEQGEVNSLVMPWGTAKAQFPRLFEDTVQLFQYGLSRDPEYPDVPLLHELVQDPKQKLLIRFLASETTLGRNLAAPPGLTAARVTMLRAAFDKMVADDAFLTDARKRHMEVGPIKGAEVQAVIEDISHTDRETIVAAKKLLGITK